uniref:G domain-containing protein n=1 Tax=Prevotella sp. GTC17253 TaxID=3236793 RepID=A0AB33INX3_9BACT
MLELLLSTFTLPEYQQQEAWFWIPIAIAATIFATIIVASSDETETSSLKGKTLGILGMPQAGKTQLLMTLQGKPYSQYEQTTVNEYKEFPLVIGDTGRTIIIQPGQDIGGSEYNITAYYEEFLKNKDICVFLFDVQKYKDDINYRSQTNIRLDFINRHIKKWPEGCAIIGTHVDKAEIKEDENIIAILQKFIEGKPYARLFNHNLFAYNLTNKTDIVKLKMKLFIEK